GRDRRPEGVPERQRGAAGQRAGPQEVLRHRDRGRGRGGAGRPRRPRRRPQGVRGDRARDRRAGDQGAGEQAGAGRVAGRHLHPHQRRRLRLPALDPDPERAPGRHPRHARDPAAPRRPEQRGRDPADDVPRPLLRPPGRGWPRGRPVPGPDQGTDRGPGVAAAGGV
ncbi:MAG: Dihydrolipoamide succinyltransferase component (E2) of 2-oxoglutarate dehydrogenase complex, partial [uncultured Thermomicrobiales bacterium]